MTQSEIARWLTCHGHQQQEFDAVQLSKAVMHQKSAVHLYANDRVHSYVGATCA